ncbi:AraC family transcriptional regulator [Brevibacillus sp. AG]|nr:AraC family transcriptional regulator [Brevibacillus sp. AG]MDC0759612.1 AraC family transcriptional regulator [Brevibacillus sp. AG]
MGWTELSSTNIQENIHLFFDRMNLESQNVDQKTKLTLHPEMGEGYVRRFLPRYDMEVVVSDYTFYRSQSISLSTKSPMVELNFCLKGERGISVQGKEHQLLPGLCSLQFISEVEARFEYVGNEPFYMLGIGIPVSTFHHFMEESNGQRSIEFGQVLGKQSFRIFQEKLSPAASVALQRVMQYVAKPGTKKIEMETGVLGLLSMAFQSFLLDSETASVPLSKRDKEKIAQARVIMLECMVDPPSLPELSRMIGLNDYKLKTGFKAMFGTTVFGYLREKRLEKALFLLQQGEMNVTETSSAIGYTNTSYFAEAFREKYGVNPSVFVRRSSNR